jgi:hypothetical protein
MFYSLSSTRTVAALAFALLVITVFAVVSTATAS